MAGETAPMDERARFIKAYRRRTGRALRCQFQDT